MASTTRRWSASSCVPISTTVTDCPGCCVNANAAPAAAGPEPIMRLVGKTSAPRWTLGRRDRHQCSRGPMPRELPSYDGGRRCARRLNRSSNRAAYSSWARRRRTGPMSGHHAPQEPHKKIPGAVSNGRLRGPEAQRGLMPDTGLSRGYVRFAITAHHRYLRCILGSGRARPSAPRGEGIVSDQPPWDPWQTQGQQCPSQQPYGQPPYDAPSRPLSPSPSSFPPLLRRR